MEAGNQTCNNNNLIRRGNKPNTQNSLQSALLILAESMLHYEDSNAGFGHPCDGSDPALRESGNPV